MKVRVYDKATGKYFKSEVYAIINPGWYEKRLVHVPSEDGGYVKFFDYLDKEDKVAQPDTLINIITSNYPNDWVVYSSDHIDTHIFGFEDLLNANVYFFKYIGYSWIFENKSVLAELLNGRSIRFRGSIFEN